MKKAVARRSSLLQWERVALLPSLFGFIPKHLGPLNPLSSLWWMAFQYHCSENCPGNSHLVGLCGGWGVGLGGGGGIGYKWQKNLCLVKMIGWSLCGCLALDSPLCGWSLSSWLLARALITSIKHPGHILGNANVLASLCLSLSIRQQSV